MNGRQVWQTSGINTFVYFRLPSNFTNAGQPIYLAITYADIGYGQTAVQYDSTQGAFTSAEVHSHSSRVNGGAFVTMYVELRQPALQHAESGNTDFRLSAAQSTSFASVTAQTAPFTDPTFTRAITTPWLTPIFGQSQPAASATTLKGAVMAGYQGWFRCPNDLDDGGWVHWTRNGSFTLQNVNVAMWPDMSAYPQSSGCRADALTLSNGQPAYVFSSDDLNVTEQHFAWMQQYNIDGVFLQRFLGPNQVPGSNPEWVLANVRRAAADHGRIWTIEYDISGLSDANVVQTVESDWTWLVNSAHIRQDSSYAHENGKPGVVLWGCSVRPISVANCDTLVNFLKSDPSVGGNYVIGGISTGWSSTLSTWQEHYARYNGVLVWMTQSFQQDVAQFSGMGLDYYGDVWPGGSCNNELQQVVCNTDRLGGQFYWNDIYSAVSAGTKRMFVGMFDEYDEGTAIMPMSNTAPAPPPVYGYWQNNEGQPETWWLQLTEDARSAMNGQSSITQTMP